jgi:PAS domain S-box-containing protein
MARILVVDDRPLNREYLVTLLHHVGHTSAEAGDGAEALALAEAERPDLIITDILMPGMDGYDFAERIRRHPSLAATPIIFYTATYRAHEARSLAETVGVSRVLAKPAEPEAVLAAVADVLGGATAPRETAIEPERSRLTTLVEILLDIGGRKDRAEVVDLGCRAARALVGSTIGVVGMLGPDPRSLRYVSANGVTSLEEGGAHPPLELGRGPLAPIMGQARPVRLAELPGDPQALGLPASYPAVRTLLGVPVTGRERVIGCVLAANKRGATAFSEEDQRLLETLAAALAATYESAALREDLERNIARLAQETSERRSAEGRGQASESRYRALFERNLAGVFRSSTHGRVLECNDACACLLGFDPSEEFLARSAVEHALRTPEGMDLLAALRREERPNNVELTFKRRDGTPIEVLASLSLVPDDLAGGGIVQGILVDITDQKRLDARLRESRTMEAVGRLAAGVAQEVGNLLPVISGYGDQIIERLPRKDPLLPKLRDMFHAVQRATDLMRRLHSLGQRESLEPRVVALDTLLTDVDRTLRRLLGKGVEFATIVEPTSACVRADPWYIEQVILLLALNAKDAMPRGGRLTVEIRNVDLDPVAARKITDVRPGPYVLLSVSDTGIGMDAETRAHIFEPFFSTKGSSLGLGLSTVYALVEQSGGRIEVESQPGVGSTFRIYLPRVNAAAPASALPGAAPPGPAAAPPRGTVLVVEDDTSVRSLVRDILEEAGYIALVASDGVDAIRIGRDHVGPIELVLTDVVMPGMNGRDLVDRLSATRPSIRAVYMSGYSDDTIVHHGVLEPGIIFVGKPFTRHELMRKVAEAVGERPGALEVGR